MNHSSLQTDSDCNDFPSLLKSVVSVVNNMTRSQNGMALIASRVKGNETDAEMIADIVTFIQDVKEELPQALAEAHLTPAVQFLDALLSQEGK